MAKTTRAKAQPPVYRAPPTEAQCLAMRTVDEIGYLEDHLKAYEAIERLVSTEDPRADLSHLERNHLSWLLMVVNAGIREQLAKSFTAARAAAALAYGRQMEV